MAEPSPPEMPVLRGGTDPHETATSVRPATLADRVQAALAAAMGRVAAVVVFLKAELADLRADAEAALAAEATARTTAVSNEATARTNADTSIRTDFAAADSGLQGQINTKAPTASPTLTGTPNTTHPGSTDDSTRIPTTAWSRDTFADWGTVNSKAPLASPAFTGSPTTTYPPAGDNSSRIPSTDWCRDTFADWGTVNGKASLSSPNFNGTPTAPTAALGNYTTQIATTAYVMRESDLVEEYLEGVLANKADWGTVNSKAPLNSPLFTGDVRAPTPGNTDWDVTVATTAFVKNQNYVVSDRATKTDFEAFGGAESGSLVDGMAVHAYRYKDDEPGRRRRVGLVAQELQDLFPDAVVQPPGEGEPLRIDLRALVPVLLAEAKALRARVAALENRGR